MDIETKTWLKTLGYILVYTIAYIILICLLKLNFNLGSFSLGLSAYAIYLGFCAKGEKDEEEKPRPLSLGISADDARLLMGGRNNEVLEGIYRQIETEAMAGKESLLTSIDPGECNIGYIGESLEKRGYVVEIDRSIPGPLFYFIISWTKK
jgi:hypothetical protein